MDSSLTHRHFVIAPLFVGVLSFSMVSGVAASVLPPAAPTFTAQVVAPGTLVQFTNGVEQLVYSGKGVQADGEFAGGKVLIKSAANLKLTWGKSELTVFDGAFYLASQGESLTIAALTTPVTVKQGNRYAVVPAGYQWRTQAAAALPNLEAGAAAWQASRAVTALPNHFKKQQLKNLGRFLGPSTKLPAWPRLGTPAATAALTDLMQDPAQGLTLALHPTYRDTVWVQFAPPAPELAAVRAYALPLADQAYAPLSPLTLERFADQAIFLQQQLGQADFLTELITVGETQVQAQARAGRPLRAQRWSETLVQMANYFNRRPVALQGLERRMSEYRSSGVSEYRSNRVSEYPNNRVAEDMEPGKVADEGYDAVALEERARLWLQQLGALYTVNTNLVATGPDTVAVTDIVLPMATGEQGFSFEVNFAKQTVGKLSIANRMVPHGLTMVAFKDWLQG